MVTMDDIRRMMRRFKVRGLVAPAGWAGISPDEIAGEYVEVLGQFSPADLKHAVGIWLADMVSAEVHIRRKVPTPEDLLARMPGIAGQLRASQGQGAEWWGLLQQTLSRASVASATYHGGYVAALVGAGIPPDVAAAMDGAAHVCSSEVAGEYYQGWAAVRHGGSGQSSSRAAWIAVMDSRARSSAEQGRPFAPVAEVGAVLEARHQQMIAQRDAREARLRLAGPTGRAGQARALTDAEAAARDERRAILSADPVQGLRVLTGGIGGEV